MQNSVATAPGRLPWQTEQSGLLTLPGSNRQVWWTGRVAIGLRYQRAPSRDVSASEDWIQQVLLQARH